MGYGGTMRLGAIPADKAGLLWRRTAGRRFEGTGTAMNNNDFRDSFEKTDGYKRRFPDGNLWRRGIPAKRFLGAVPSRI